MIMNVDLIFGVIPSLAMLGYLVVSFIIFCAGSREESSDRALPVEFFYWLVEPIVTGLARMRVKPNQVTGASLVVIMFASLAIATGHFFMGLWMLMVGSSFDVLDGFLARKTEQTTSSGAFFDSFIDRVAEGVVFMGFAYLGQGGLLTVGAIAALIGSYSVSYARARGEGLGVKPKVGLMQRPQRLGSVILTLAVAAFASRTDAQLGLSILTLGIWLVAIGASFTAGHRAWWAMNRLDADEERPIETGLGDAAIESRTAA